MQNFFMSPDPKVFEAALKKLQLLHSAKLVEKPNESSGGCSLVSSLDEETVVLLAEKGSYELVELIGKTSKSIN